MCIAACTESEVPMFDVGEDHQARCLRSAETAKTRTGGTAAEMQSLLSANSHA